MANGSQKRGGGSSGGGSAVNKRGARQASTPSGITYDQFMQMSVKQREQTIIDILNNDNIAIPDYLDQTATQKVMYALGMNGKPQVMNDAELDKMKGTDLFRTVNDNKYLSGNEILDQIAQGDYTRLSDSGGSAYGRGIYFANDLKESLWYGNYGQSSVMRMKLASDANIVTYNKVAKGLYSSSLYTRMETGLNWEKLSYKQQPDSSDYVALRALSQGIDGWVDKGSGYYVILNRSKTAVSSTYKRFTEDTDTFGVTWNKMTNAN